MVLPVSFIVRSGIQSIALGVALFSTTRDEASYPPRLWYEDLRARRLGHLPPEVALGV